MNYNPFSLKGKTIFITGASSGIGKAVAIECAKMGANLIISGRNSGRLLETLNTLEGFGHIQLLADLSSNEKNSEIVDRLPSIDGIVFSAGYTKILPFQFINETDINKLMQVNFMSPALLSQLLVKNKKLNKGASIVFISSISGVFCSSVAGTIYSASKGAVNGLVKAMAIDLSSKNIRVNSVNPGMINTNIISHDMISSEQFQEDIKKYPLKRYGRPEEVAFAVIYLLSDAAKWVTGSNLLIDGGFTLL